MRKIELKFRFGRFHSNHRSAQDTTHILMKMNAAVARAMVYTWLKFELPRWSASWSTRRFPETCSRLGLTPIFGKISHLPGSQRADLAKNWSRPKPVNTFPFPNP